MAKYIDAEKLKRTLIDKYSFLPAFVVRAIEEAPVADVVSRETHEAIQKALIAFAETDVVPVVRCENCAFANKQVEFKNLYVCLQNERFVKKDDFCSYGERKDND